MNRVYKHQYIIKRATNIGELQEKENTAQYRLFKFYQRKLTRIQRLLPEQIAPREYEKDLVITRGMPLVTLLYKEVNRYNILLGIINRNLKETLASLQG